MLALLTPSGGPLLSMVYRHRSSSAAHGLLGSSTLTTTSVGALTSSLVRESAADVVRTRQAIARSTKNYLYLLCTREGDWSVALGEQRATLLGGDLAIVDSQERYAFHFPISKNLLSIELPIAWLERCIAKPRAYLAHPDSRKQRLGQSIARILAATLT